MFPLVPATAKMDGYGAAIPCVVPGWPAGTRIAAGFEKVALAAQLALGEAEGDGEADGEGEAEAEAEGDGEAEGVGDGPPVMVPMSWNN